jgi:hypothetical protein
MAMITSPVKLGVTSEDVGTVQTLLKAKGLYLGKPDNKCGPKTVAAIKEFQAKMTYFDGKVPDGAVSPNGPTWQALNSTVGTGLKMSPLVRGLVRQIESRPEVLAARAAVAAGRVEPKKIETEADTIEVLVSDRLNTAASSFGHVAIVVNGIVYSRAHSKYATIPFEKYIDMQRKIRNSLGYVLRVSKENKNIIEKELKRRVAITDKNPEENSYNLVTNSCSSNIADVLDMVGIVAYDPRGFGIASPSDLSVGLSRCKQLIKTNHYSKYTK